ncbi:MAG TPA: trehalose-phosphatase [Candidatus Acidoferrales bacterium]|nr:trehalose-phosphatase [Candidatus Acidoferrales bacterium]
MRKAGTQNGKPHHLWKCWNRIARKIGPARKVALFADFDGTLVRIKKDPGHARLAPEVRRLLARIASKGAVVGIVSGRTVTDAQERVGLNHIWYAGAHGFFLRDPSNRSFTLASPRQLKRIRAARRFLERRLRRLPGVRLEPKEATIAVHYRGAPKRSERRARRVVSETLIEYPDLFLLTGKKLLELVPNSQTDKWKAIRFILQKERNSNSRQRRVIFIGDDATDESVFRKLPDISIAVGKKNRTAAKYYLYSPAGVRRFLKALDERIS